MKEIAEALAEIAGARMKYGTPGTRDVDVVEWNDRLDALDKALRAVPMQEAPTQEALINAWRTEQDVHRSSSSFEWYCAGALRFAGGVVQPEPQTTEAMVRIIRWLRGLAADARLGPEHIKAPYFTNGMFSQDCVNAANAIEAQPAVPVVQPVDKE